MDLTLDRDEALRLKCLELALGTTEEPVVEARRFYAFVTAKPSPAKPDGHSTAAVKAALHVLKTCKALPPAAKNDAHSPWAVGPVTLAVEAALEAAGVQ